MTVRGAIRSFLICTAFLAFELPGYLERPENEPLPPWGNLLTVAAVRWYSWMAVIPFADRVVRSTAPGSRQAFVRHLAIAATFIVAHNIAIDSAVYVAGWGREPIRLSSLLPRTVPDAVLYAALATVLTVVESRRRRIESDARLRTALAEARLDALRQQLNPHFLFNTLNHVVMQLRLNETKEALQMLLTLGDLLRLVLADRAQLTTVGRELSVVELYLQIERARFGDNLNVDISVDVRVLDAMVPSFMLQPLLENAMRHGISHDGRCQVRLAIHPEGERLLIDVSDEGRGPSSSATSAGIGLANTRERLRHLYGDNQRLDLRARQNSGAIVSVDIPLQQEA